MLRPVDLKARVSGRTGTRGGQALASLVLQGGLRFLVSFLVGRFTGPATLAVVSSGMSLANLLTLVWPTTTGEAASRFVARSRGEGSDVNAVAAFLGRRTLLAALPLSILSIPIWLHLGGTLAGAGVIALLVASFSCYCFARGVHYGAGQTSRQLKWDLVTTTSAVAGVLLVLLSEVPTILVLGVLAVTYGVYALACWPWQAGGGLGPAARREIDVFVAWGSLGTLASAGFAQFAMIVAVAVAGHAEAGQFAAAMVLAAPAAMVANSLAQVLFPSMAEALGRGDTEAVRWQLDQSTRALTAIMVLIFGVVVIGCRPLVELVWGSRYAEAAQVAPLLLIPAMWRSIASPSQGAISVSTRGGIVFSSLASVAGFAVGALVWWTMPQGWGVMGVATGYALGTLLIAAAIYVRAWTRSQQRWATNSVLLILVSGLIWVISWQLAERSTGFGVDLLAVGVFVVTWGVLQRRQLVSLWTRVRRRG
ncbi:hypothetical protein ASG73_16275 [Janibacter sp. Soil728]|nr:hypothetical protein ASG73_16275 [Janibacter sp. Soil728]